MAFNLDSITKGVVSRPPRIILLGTAKIGKSYFASKSYNPIFIPIRREEGIDDIDAAKFPVCNTLDDARSAFHTLRTGAHDFGTVVVDSFSTLESLVWQEVCERTGDKNGKACDGIEKVLGGYNKGFGQALNQWNEIMDWLDILRTERNMTSILIGHVHVKRFDDPNGSSYDQYRWDVQEKAAGSILKWADAILFANTKTLVREEDIGFNKTVKKAIDTYQGSRFLYTQARPAHPGGGRGPYGQLPYELPLDWSVFMNHVQAAGRGTQS
jgi:hypothetical protein